METLKSLGNTISKYRKNSGITQERLAEQVGVSVSAVSQWESGKTMPDICTIPLLCHILNVSSDELLEISREKDDEEIKRMAEEANRLMSRGRLEETESLLLEARERFPGSFDLMSAMMYLYYDMAMVSPCTGNQEPSAWEGYLRKCIDLAQKILEGCRDSSFLNGARQMLCYSYSFLGEDEKAIAIAREMPTMSVCRESLLSLVSKDRDRYQCKQSEMRQHLQALCVMLDNYNMKFDDGSFAFAPAEEAALAQKSIDILHILFEKEDFGFFHDALMRAHFHIARIAAGHEKDREKALSHLKEAVDHGEAFLGNNPEKMHTSLFTRGREIGSFSTNGRYNSTFYLLENLKKDCFDFMREEPEFMDLVKRLQRTAGPWKQ